MQKFTEEPLIECALAEDGKVNTDFEIPSPFKLFNQFEKHWVARVVVNTKNWIGSHANQNGREREVSEDEFSAFLGIYILMGIHKLPSIKS